MHFTYQRRTLSDHLSQGDLLRREPLEGLLSQTHPNYTKEDYHYFLVLTQSCDLVRVDGRPDSRYVTICPCRPLKTVFRRHLESFQKEVERVAGVCEEAAKEKAKRFLDHLLNNNQPGFFYLHEDPENGIGFSVCAFLQLPVSVKSDSYDTLLAARICGLKQSFQAKLGWLTGHIYSRVGTDDWVPSVLTTRAEFDQMLSQLLDRYAVWVDRRRHRVLLKEFAENPPSHELSRQEIEALLEDARLESPIDSALARVKSIAAESADLASLASDPRFDELLKVLRNDPVFTATMRK